MKSCSLSSLTAFPKINHLHNLKHKQNLLPSESLSDHDIIILGHYTERFPVTVTINCTLKDLIFFCIFLRLVFYPIKFDLIFREV